jgi:hypothetical protein
MAFLSLSRPSKRFHKLHRSVYVTYKALYPVLYWEKRAQFMLGEDPVNASACIQFFIGKRGHRASMP